MNRKVYDGVPKRIKVKRLTPEQIRAKFTDKEWGEMLELMRESLAIGAGNPVLAYELQRKIVKLYAEPKLGMRAADVLGVLKKEVDGG
ncbi:MAG: hypothetical protein GXN93_03825 [Candidatus Diapherotrites archaeon]|nr:hypothetical protein [Candidatus Diapherotrites archaeon]